LMAPGLMMGGDRISSVRAEIGWLATLKRG
jgi:hypothetical protein